MLHRHLLPIDIQSDFEVLARLRLLIERAIEIYRFPSESRIIIPPGSILSGQLLLDFAGGVGQDDTALCRFFRENGLHDRKRLPKGKVVRQRKPTVVIRPVLNSLPAGVGLDIAYNVLIEIIRWPVFFVTLDRRHQKPDASTFRIGVTVPPRVSEPPSEIDGEITAAIPVDNHRVSTIFFIVANKKHRTVRIYILPDERLPSGIRIIVHPFV